MFCRASTLGAYRKGVYYRSLSLMVHLYLVITCPKYLQTHLKSSPCHRLLNMEGHNRPQNNAICDGINNRPPDSPPSTYLVKGSFRQRFAASSVCLPTIFTMATRVCACAGKDSCVHFLFTQTDESITAEESRVTCYWFRDTIKALGNDGLDLGLVIDMIDKSPTRTEKPPASPRHQPKERKGRSVKDLESQVGM